MKRALSAICMLLANPAFSNYAHPQAYAKIAEYHCGGLDVKVDFYSDKAHLTIIHYNYILRRTRSASGALYFNEIMSFWDKGQTALITYRNNRQLDCELISKTVF